jgi:hypothetical protein
MVFRARLELIDLTAWFVGLSPPNPAPSARLEGGVIERAELVGQEQRLAFNKQLD